MSERPASDGDMRLRPLLPAGKRPPVKPTGPILRPRLNPVSAACTACRSHKSKCSGERPACRRCQRLRLNCQYTTKPGETEAQARNRTHRDLRGRAAAHEEVLQLLRNLPEKDAQAVLQRIRAGTDIATIVNHVKGGSLLLQMAVSPETRFRYEFPYGLEMPEEYVANNPYLDSLIYEASSLYSASGSYGRSSQAVDDRNTIPSPNEYQNYQDPYLKPFHAAKIVDPRLFDVKMSLWTSVCDDDMLMRNLLSGWLCCEYQFTAIFQKDLFLEDMAAQREDFCSSLLVNIMLGYSCVCSARFSNQGEYWDPHSLMYRFVAEAKRLWELEADKPRITTIQAGILFNVFHNLCGLDEIGQTYRIQAISLAHDMHLFDSATGEQSERIRHGRAFTAWGLFNWETLVGFSFVFAPLLSEPPDWRLPNPSEEAEWYGEIWVRYPLSDCILPSHFGQVFRARSQFRVIMNRACQAAYSKDSEMTLDKARTMFSQLRSWYDSLPGLLSPKTIVLPGHLQLHMYYHHLILTVFEPLIDAKTNQEPSPQRLVADAKKHLHTLVRLYYLRHGYEAMDLFIVIPLMLVASECLEAINEHTPASELESLRSTLILATKGLHNQRRNHFLAEALFRVVRGRMRPSEVALFKGILNVDEEKMKERPYLTQTVRSQWPVSVVKKKEDLDAQILTSLVKNYAHLNIEGSQEDELARETDVS